MQFLRRIASRFPPIGTVRNAPLATKPKGESTYNDLPQPLCPWQKYYDRDQRDQNGHLIFGLSLFLFTLLFGKLCGLFRTYNDIPECVPDRNYYGTTK